MERAPEAGSGYRFQSRRLDLDQASPRNARMLEVWRAQCAGSPMPPPEFARFDAFPFAIGHLHLIEVRPGGRFFYRIFGSSSHYPLDYHRRTTGQIRPDALRAVVEADYCDVVETGAPSLREITIAAPRREARFRRLLLPYGPPGGLPTLMVACVDEEPALADIFRDPAFAAGAELEA